MHTFDCVEWDPVVGRMVVVHHPVHVRFEMAERFPMFHGDWNLSLKSSHWEYDPDSKTWQRFNFDPPDLFARALTRNPATGQLIATDGARTWTFDRAAARWITHEKGTAGGWHLKLAFDTYARQALLLGNNQSSGVLYAWDPVKLDWRTVEVNRQPLPANGAAMAYDTRNHVLLYLANDYENQYHNPTGKAVTFIYHSEGQRWERLEIESPELYGMNYLTQYDPVRNVFLHFERSPASTGERLRVWAFRYR
jgi:hypothetical protein